MTQNSWENKITINKSTLDFKDFSENKFKISLNRVAFIFLIIFSIILLYSTRVIYLSSKLFLSNNQKTNSINRADITDRNGNVISKSVFVTNVGIDPKLVKEIKKLLIKLQYTFPESDISEIKRKILGKKFFYIKKKVIPDQIQKIRLLGENPLY